MCQLCDMVRAERTDCILALSRDMEWEACINGLTGCMMKHVCITAETQAV